MADCIMSQLSCEVCVCEPQEYPCVHCILLSLVSQANNLTIVLALSQIMENFLMDLRLNISLKYSTVEAKSKTQTH